MIGRAAALTNLGDKDRAFRAKKQAFGSFFRFSPCRCALMRRKLRQRQIPSFGRRTVRVCRETDFSGCCFARKYDGMGTSEKSLPLSPVSPAERTRLRGAEAPQRKPRAAPAKGGLEGMSKRGFLRLLLRPEIQLHGDAEKKASLCHPCRQPSAPACGVPRRRNGSRAQRRQREVWRECRNEDFSGCYFARKYNCMGTPEKSHCSRILFSKKRR